MTSKLPKSLEEMKESLGNEQVTDNCPWLSGFAEHEFGVDMFHLGFDAGALAVMEQAQLLETRIEGMILSLKQHGQNINIQFHIDWLESALSEWSRFKGNEDAKD